MWQDYYPFGTTLQSAGIASRYGYQGEYAEKDNETGWNNFYLRNYDPAIGRWLSTAPYGQYYSPYVGMGNNPITGFDPDGGWSANGNADPIMLDNVNVWGRQNLSLWNRMLNSLSSSFTLPDHPYFHGSASGAYRPWQGPQTAEEWMRTGDILSMTNIPGLAQVGDFMSLGERSALGTQRKLHLH
ncbi:RHS repeat-associated core domain-containing protein [Sphingobacterium sp. LRF_L2]|uniref:RHS repeat-associated core domain-containing protein n=1 Tax=Sphingobacterium sp. LRF_L2 TaxID=3369421 RepID=UPI003F6347ED